MAQPTYSHVPGESVNLDLSLRLTVDSGQFSSPYLTSTPTMPSAPLADGYSPTPPQPNLMRSTQIQPVGLPVPVATFGTTPSTGTAKAKLELAGDLDLMSKGWFVMPINAL